LRNSADIIEILGMAPKPMPECEDVTHWTARGRPKGNNAGAAAITQLDHLREVLVLLGKSVLARLVQERWLARGAAPA
jgi:hypothetical protein